jgi:hypothetical protein
MHSVKIVQDGKVLAVDKHFGFTGAGTQNNVYRVELKDLSNAPLTLRAAISTDWGPDSHGRITRKSSGAVSRNGVGSSIE